MTQTITLSISHIRTYIWISDARPNANMIEKYKDIYRYLFSPIYCGEGHYDAITGKYSLHIFTYGIWIKVFRL